VGYGAEFSANNSAEFQNICCQNESMQSKERRVAVIDDEENVREVLEVSLTLAGFSVASAIDGARGLALVREWQPDCVLLDVMMPRVDGISLLPSLRRLTEAPVLLLTARGDLANRVAGLNAGADDYICKPFDLEELLARITTALRRPILKRAALINHEDLEIDLEARTVRRGKRQIEMTARQFDLLATLARRPKRVFTRVELLDLVWGPDRDAAPSTINTHISYIRAKIDDRQEPGLIQTVHGVGYALQGAL
jgi:DNA-binding response OmpR family regulator